MEGQLLREEVKLPVYFITETDEINSYYDYIQSEGVNQQDTSAFQTLLDTVFTNGFQFDISAAQSQPIVHSSQQFQAVNLQGKLNGGYEMLGGQGQQAKIPTILVTAHYDAFGLATVNNLFNFHTFYG